MEDLKARMFNRKASNPRGKPKQILEALALKQGQTVADIGAGGGYFSLRFAETVGEEGSVLAADTNPGFLEFIENSAKEEGLNNIQTILIVEEDLRFPRRSLDLIFMRNVCHHLKNRVEYFRALRNTLKSEGRVAILEYRRSSPLTFRGIFRHYVPQAVIIDEMDKADYRVEKSFDFLPEQSFTIFSPQKTQR